MTRETRKLQTVDNALRLLMHLARARGPVGVTQLSRELGLGKSVVHSLLSTLKARRFVEQDPDSSYRLGYQLLVLGESVQGEMGIRRLALPVMRELVDYAQEAGYLMVPGRNVGILLDRVDPDNEVRVTMEIGQVSDLHAGASSKAILAFLSPGEIEEYIRETGLPRITRDTTTDPQELREELAEIRRRGYSYSEQQLFEGIAGLAAPVLDRHGRVVASVGLASLIQRLRPRREELAPAVMDAAGQISRSLGHRVRSGAAGNPAGGGSDGHG